MDWTVLQMTSMSLKQATSLQLQPPKHFREQPLVKSASLIPVSSTAKKCPRRQNEPECTQCRHLLAENKELRESDALLTEQLNAQRLDVQPSEAPRPGKISKELAERYQADRLYLQYMYMGHNAC